MKKGFTLTEILLAVLIVGIILVLTIPGIYDDTKKRSYVSNLQNVHNALKTAINNVMTEERTNNLGNSTYTESAAAFLTKYFKPTLDCGTNYTDCLATSYKSLNGSTSKSTSEMLSDDFYCISVASGSVICSTKMEPDESDGTHGNSKIIIDVNGKNLPNTNGRDLFYFDIYTDGKIANRYNISENDANGTTCSNRAASAGYAGACFSKIVADGWAMDY